MFFILVFYPPAHLDCPHRSHQAPPTLLTGQTSSPLPPALRAPFWLVVVFDQSSGLLRQDFFFLDYFISFSLPPGTKRDTPPHASTTPPSTPHRHERHRRRRRRAPAGIGRLPNRTPLRPPPHPAAKPTPPPFPPCRGASRRKRTPNRPTHPSPALPPGASCGGAMRVPAAGLRGGNRRPQLPRGGGTTRRARAERSPRGGDNAPGSLWSLLRGGSGSQ
jgi:hypothetical protein